MKGAVPALQVIVGANKCEAGCGKWASFGSAGERARFCKAHMEAGMECLRGATCQAPGCKTQSVFGVPGHRARFCKEHKTDDMVSRRLRQGAAPARLPVAHDARPELVEGMGAGRGSIQARVGRR